MARPIRHEKKRIVVFCEGESEQAYMSFLKKNFGDVATFKWPSSPGLFDIADNKFKKDKSYRDYAAKPSIRSTMTARANGSSCLKLR